MTTILHSMSVGFSRSSDPQGKVTKYHLKEYSNCITSFSCSSFTTAQYIIQPIMNNQDLTNPEFTVRIRKLTPRECFRLMDVPEWAIERIQSTAIYKGEPKPIISKTQQYKMAGNSIVVACLYHIFRNLFVTPAPAPPRQPSLFD